MAQMALQLKLDRARGFWRALLALEGWLWTLAALLVTFLLVFHLDRFFILGVEQRVAAWAVLGILSSACAIFLIIRPLLQPRPAEQVAIQVERRYPQLRERLLSAIEFAGLPVERRQGVSQALMEDVQADAEREASGLNFMSAFEKDGLARSAVSLGVVLLVLGLHLAFAGPAFGAFLSRMALNNTPVWRDTRVQVDPLRSKVLKGSDFVVKVEQEGVRVSRAQLSFQFKGGRMNRAELKAGPKGGFTHRFVALTESMDFYATAGDGRSDRGQVEVVDPAVITGAKLKLTYPAYMQRKPAVVASDTGGVAAPVGTRVELELKASKALDGAQVVVGKAAPVSWTVAGDTVSGSVLVKQNGQYTLRLKDTDGFFAPEAQTFPIKAIPDETPEVHLVQPEGDLDVTPDARVPLSILAKDDYGVAEVRVPYEVTGRKPQTLPAGRGDAQAKTLELQNAWSLAALNLKPGDTVRYRVEAVDFDTLNGPHVGKTSEFQLRIIDRGEAERRYEEQRAEVQRQLQELIREQKSARADVEAQRNAAKPNAEAIASAEERQRAAATTAADLARRMNELNRTAETNNLAAKPELDSQRASQSSLSKLAQEAMPQAANRVGSAQTQAQSNPQEAKSQLGEASRQQEQILQELGKIAQGMRPTSELQRMAERFERLAKEQRNLQAQAEKLLPQTLGKNMNELTPEQRAQLQQLGQQQSNLQKATAQAMQGLEQAAKGMQGSKPEQAQAAQEVSQGLQQAQVTEQQQQASQNAQQNALGQARSQQQQAAQELENAAQQLRQAASPNDPRQLERQLRQAANQLNRMLQRQQEAIEQSRKLMSPQEQKQAAEQQKEQQRQAEELRRQLQRLERRSPSAGNAAKAMQQASQSLGQSSQSLSQGQQSQAQQQEQQAQQAMQRAMQSLQQAMAEAGEKNEDPFAELRKQLRGLAERQKAVLQGTRIAADRQVKTADGFTARLEGEQGSLERDTAKLEPELPGDVFRAFSGQARGAMKRSQEGLKGGNVEPEPTQEAQERALTLLEQLAKALDSDSKDNEKEQQQSGGGGQQGGGGGKPDPELLKRIAEIRLLRAMEQGIRSQTQDVDDSRRRDTPLTDAQKRQVEEAARQQAQAKGLAERVAQGLGKYQQLAGKVSQAGKHMGEAQRGLDQSDTGEGTQEQETQSIIRLTDALKSAQQQAQQQSQSRSRQQQQQQQQQGGRQQQQQAGRQPQGGSPQQQQQGSSAAMQSLQRRANREDGPLGAFGSGGSGFGLDPRSQDALRQGYKEKSPAEYQDLNNRYFRALSNKGR